MTVSKATKLIVDKRVASIISGADLDTLNGLESVKGGLHWSLVSDSWVSPESEMLVLASAIGEHGSNEIISLLPAQTSKLLFEAIALLNTRDILTSTWTAEGRLSWEDSLRAYCRWQGNVNRDVLISFISSVFDPIKIHAFILLDPTLLNSEVILGHLANLAVMHGLDETITLTEVAEDEELNSWVTLDADVPYFVAKYLGMRSFYKDYLDTGVAPDPISGSDLPRIVINELHTANGLLFGLTE